jgi:hypothetical protein
LQRFQILTPEVLNVCEDLLEDPQDIVALAALKTLTSFGKQASSLLPTLLKKLPHTPHLPHFFKALGQLEYPSEAFLLFLQENPQHSFYRSFYYGGQLFALSETLAQEGAKQLLHFLKNGSEEEQKMVLMSLDGFLQKPLILKQFLQKEPDSWSFLCAPQTKAGIPEKTLLLRFFRTFELKDPVIEKEIQKILEGASSPLSAFERYQRDQLCLEALQLLKDYESLKPSFLVFLEKNPEFSFYSEALATAYTLCSFTQPLEEQLLPLLHKGLRSPTARIRQESARILGELPGTALDLMQHISQETWEDGLFYFLRALARHLPENPEVEAFLKSYLSHSLWTVRFEVLWALTQHQRVSTSPRTLTLTLAEVETALFRDSPTVNLPFLQVLAPLLLLRED